MPTNARFALRVTYADGQEAWLRHGAVTGDGLIVLFSNRERAEARAAELRAGLDEGDVVMVVAWGAAVRRDDEA